MFVPDDLITAEVDARDYADRKLAALRAHATQITADGPFFKVSDVGGPQAIGVEEYRLVKGTPGPVGQDGRETDLFAGIQA
jgi:N-acetyl-1-D-myo-inositol-2-amino-2-deoxy-alpha-D-glucopyranoside deacetylase